MIDIIKEIKKYNKTFIDESSIIKKVIFNVFDDENLAIYQKLLAES